MTHSISSSSSCSSRMSSSSTLSNSAQQNTTPSSPVTSVALEQITQLTHTQRETIPISTDPAIFFKQFRIKTFLFGESDIQLLLNLFQKTKLNQTICLFDLVGLQLYRLLKQLTASLPESRQKNLKKDWAAFYLASYLGVLRFQKIPEFTIPKTASSENFFFTPKKSMQVFRTFTNDLTQEIEAAHTGNKKSKKVLDFQKEKMKPIWAEWHALNKFLEKCFVQENPNNILCLDTLTKCSGSEVMIPTSKSEVLEAIQNLYLYLEMIVAAETSAIEKGGTLIQCLSFKQLLTAEPLLTNLKDTKQIIARAKELLKSTSQNISSLNIGMERKTEELALAKAGRLTHEAWCQQNGIQKDTKKSQDQFIESLTQITHQIALEMCWLDDCQSILEESIIIPLDPSFNTSHAYVNRIQANLITVFEEAADVVQKIIDADGSLVIRPITPLAEELQNIKLIFFFLLKTEGFFETVTQLHQLLEGQYGVLLINHVPTNSALTVLEMQINNALDKICALDPKACQKEPLSQQLIWLSRMFVLLHDLNFLTNSASERSDLDIFPQRFLDFLTLEKRPEEPKALSFSPKNSDMNAEIFPDEPLLPLSEIESSNSSSSDSELPSLPTPKETPQKASPISLENVAVKSVLQRSKLPAASLPAPKISKRNKNKQSSPPEVKSISSSRTSPPAQSKNPGVTPLDLLQSKKRRDVEKILKQLGLKPIRSGRGDHTIWGNPDDATIQTVVPHHYEIALGTRKSMIEHITPARDEKN